MLLLAASIAGGTPVNLKDTLPGIDRRNASLVVSAVAHAAGLPDLAQIDRRRQTAAVDLDIPPARRMVTRTENRYPSSSRNAGTVPTDPTTTEPDATQPTSPPP